MAFCRVIPWREVTMSKILDTWTVQRHDALTEVDDGILSVAGEIKMPLGNFPRRMTAVRFAGHRTVIFSAIALDEPEMARIEAMGQPAVLIVPGDAHRLDARIWKQRYPHIHVITPPGARDAVAEAVPVDATHDILNDPEVRFITVAGTGGHEAALVVRRKSGVTIICNDVIGNVAHPHGIGANVMGRLMGFGVSEPEVPRVVKHRVIDDPIALAAQFGAWAAEPDLRRVIVSHGDIIEDEPAGVLNMLAEKLSA
jgi:hypothetical protein